MMNVNNLVMTVALVLVVTIGVATGITITGSNSTGDIPVCLIDKPIEDCEIYESGNAAWTPIIFTGGK